ncbi:MAG: tripartite tricarboxylate transporter permease, partial [Chloroflexota bacterium]|nr:tripartite tricarboxylate transporter permease [Chloroflexota bacterium]
ALSLISIGAEGNLSKGLIMGCLGLILSFVGSDPVTGGTDRFSFGSLSLAAGIPIVVSTLGIFALAQVFDLLGQGSSIAGEMVRIKDSVLAGFGDVLRRPMTVLRAGLVGMYIGILPALGVSLAGITAYLVEKKYSSEKDQFGKGAPSGLIAAEVGKGCCVVGDLIPTFALGVPGSITGAILMGALIIHGVSPGPTFLLSGVMPYAIFAGIILAQVAFTLAGIPLARVCSYLVYVPNALLAPMIAFLCFFGAYVERNSMPDILVMIAFGVFGYVVRRMGYSVVCLILGLIMGPLVEANFHRTLGMGFGSFGVFFTRPIAVSLILITLLFIGWPYAKRLWA